MLSFFNVHLCKPDIVQRCNKNLMLWFYLAVRGMGPPWAGGRIFSINWFSKYVWLDSYGLRNRKTANKDTQTQGGTKGFSLRSSAVTRYYLTANYYTRSCIRQFREMINVNEDTLGQPDLWKTGIVWG